MLYLEQTTQDAVRHQSFRLINVVEKTPLTHSGSFSLFKLYMIYKGS